MAELKWRHVWLTKRSDGRRSPYCINWIDDDGKPRRLSFPTREAQRRAKDLKERELNSWARPPAVRTWTELFAEYGVHVADRSAGHQEKIAKLLERFEAICRPTQSNRITPDMCSHFMAERAKGEPAELDRDGKPLPLTPPSSATRWSEWQNLSTFFNWAVQRGYMPANPMEGVHRPPLPRRVKKAPRDWTSILRVLLDPELAVDDPQGWHVLILLGVISGYRQSVLLNCYFGVPVEDRKRMAQLEARHRRGFSVVQLGEDGQALGTLFTYTGKTHKETIIGLPAVINERIARRIADLPAGSERLFLWSNWQKKAWERIKLRAGLPALTFHGLRAVSGTQAAIAQAARAAAQHLDHSSSRVTRAHYLDEHQIAHAVAIGQSLPELPELPPFELRLGHLARGGRPAMGIGPRDRSA